MIKKLWTFAAVLLLAITMAAIYTWAIVDRNLGGDFGQFEDQGNAKVWVINYVEIVIIFFLVMLPSLVMSSMVVVPIVFALSLISRNR